MKSTSLSQLHPLFKLIIAILFAFVLTNMIYPLFLILGAPFFNISIKEAFDAVIENNDIGGINFLKYKQTVTSITLFMISSVFIALLFSGKIMDYLALNRSPKMFSVILGVIALFSAIPFISYIAKLNAAIPVPGFLQGIEEASERVEQLMGEILVMNHLSDYLINMFVIALVPAIAEELFFRGIVQRLFIEWVKNIHWGVIITAVVFSLIHMQFAGFLPRILLGLFLGYLFIWSKSLWLPIIVHFINNGIIVTVIYFSDFENMEDTMEPVTWSIGILSMIIAVSILIFMKNYESGKEFRLRL